MRLRSAALVAFALLAAAANASDVAYQDRENRQEGLLDELVTGRDYELLGVQLVADGLLDEKGERLYLGVHESAPAKLKVKVRELPSNYLMRPSAFAPGKPFAWPVEDVIEPAGLEADRLCATVSPPGRRFYYPAFIGSTPDFPSQPGYRFKFQMSVPWKLDWEIYSASDGSKVAEGSKRGSEGVDFVDWKASEAAAAPPGEYLFQGTLTLWTNPQRRDQMDVSFQKYP